MPMMFMGPLCPMNVALPASVGAVSPGLIDYDFLFHDLSLLNVIGIGLYAEHIVHHPVNAHAVLPVRELIVDGLSHPAVGDEPHLAQGTQMMGHCGSAHAQRLRQIAYADLPAGQQPEDFEPRPVAELPEQLRALKKLVVAGHRMGSGEMLMPLALMLGSAHRNLGFFHGNHLQ